MNPIEVTVEEGIATVCINRPERKNALSVAATNGLTEAWERVEADNAIRVAILTSADCGVFSAGLDLKEATQIARAEGVDILTKMRDPFHETMRACKKPIIAAMTGSLMAGGMMLTLNCDLRVGLKGTKVGITEVKIGRGSPWASPALSMLPQPVLMEIVLTGDLFPIERLHEYGFTNYIEDTPDAVRAAPGSGNADRQGRAIIGDRREGERTRHNGSGLRGRLGRGQAPARSGLCQQ